MADDDDDLMVNFSSRGRTDDLDALLGRPSSKVCMAGALPPETIDYVCQRQQSLLVWDSI